MDKNNESILLAFLYVFFALQLLCFVLFFYILSKPHNSTSQRSRGQSTILKFLDKTVISTSYVQALPMFQIYLTVLICVDEREVYGDLTCYEGTYFVHFVIALLGLLMHSIISVTVIIFTSDFNPFSNHPYATPQNRPQLYRLFIKFLLPLFALLTYSVMKVL